MYTVEKHVDRFSIVDSRGEVVHWVNVYGQTDADTAKAEELAERIRAVLDKEVDKVNAQWHLHLSKINDELQPMRTYLSNAINLT